MIVYIHVLLSRWGKLSERGLVRGLGYPKRAAFTRLTPCARAESELSDLWDVERCVAILEAQDRRLVTLHYVQCLPMAAIAAQLGCHRDTCYHRLHQVHVRVMEWLQDMAAGIPLPDEKNIAFAA